MPMRAATLLFTTICLVTYCLATCPTADFQTVIGGDTFTIKQLSSSTNLQGDILVGGIVSRYNVTALTDLNDVADLDANDLIDTSFLYVLKTGDCSVPWSYEFDYMD